MSNRRNLFKIGDEIRYIGGCTDCNNKTGTILRMGDSVAFIDLPESPHNVDYRNGICTSYNDIELIKSKPEIGEQLLLFEEV